MLRAPSEHTIMDEGDAAIVYVNAQSMYPIVLRRGQTLTMRYGALRHEFIIGRPFGSKVEATAGYVHVLRPTPELWTRCMPHNTQIIYTTDCAFVVQALDLSMGDVVCESGTGSGSMTHALVRAVAPSGHVHTFDIDQSRSNAVAKQLTQHQVDQYVTCHVRNVCTQGFGLDHEADAIFLDVPASWEALDWAKRALRQDKVCRICVFNPCIEQAQRTCIQLESEGFVQMTTTEVLSQSYRINTVQRIDWININNNNNNNNNSDDNNNNSHRQCVRWPAQQPTHTGYMTTATLLPNI